MNDAAPPSTSPDVPRAGPPWGWLSALVIGAALIAATLWWSRTPPAAPLPPLPTPTATPQPTLPLTLPLTLPPLPPPTALPVAALADTRTFTSREVVTTTLAVPRPTWTGGPARALALSADARWVAFTAASPRGYDDLYLYDRDRDELTWISQGVDGAPGSGWVGAPSITPDGGVVAFYAWAGNLVAGDTNAVQDAFVYDRAEGTLTRVSVGADGRQANGRSGDGLGQARPTLSADGRWVAFHAVADNLVADNLVADNLVADDRNGREDVFAHDRQTSATARVSLGPGGSEANGDSSHPALSADGTLVVFQSRATNLDPSVPALDQPGVWQVYLHDRSTGSTTLLSRGVEGWPGNGDSTAPALSGDGRWVVFASTASNLIAGDTNQVADIFALDRQTRTLRRVSVTATGTQANRASAAPVITLDGRHVVFASAASNLVSGDGNGVSDFFAHDLAARHTSRVSVGVMGLWTGIEADGPSRGQAAVIPGGRVVGFVAEAGNLTPPDGVGVPGLFVHERVDPPLYQLAGRVLAEGGQPVADVVVAAGPHRATTDADGRFALPNLVGGTYTLAAAKAGYSFTPPRRTVSLLRDLPDQDFVAFAAGTPDAFLELPLADEGAPSLLWLLRDTDEGGWVDAWFDHDAPTYAKNGAVLLWDGQTRNQDAYHAGLGCYARRCYDGHDGIDFPYRDPDPGTPNVFEPLLVYPAAAGRVAAVTRGCVPGDRWCNRGYGNEVLLYHDNGYFTRYSHLATVAVADGPAWVTPELPLGEMGSTGNSFGTHLHFAAHRDNGNGVWDGDGVDLPVDPFGWAGVGVDPWVAQHGGPVSRWLWRLNPTTEAILLGSQGATLRDDAGGVTVNIPADALAGQVRVELVMGAAVSPPATGLRSLGRGFRVQVLDWLVDGSAANATPARPLEMSVSFAGAALRHVDMTQLFLYQRRDGQGWQPVPTVVDAEAQVALAATNLLGDFDLLAPLLCPADDLEPDDSFDAAAFVPAAGGIWARLFDVVEDEDWFQIEAAAGVTYAVTVDELAPGVAVSVAVYDQDGLTRLDGRRGAGTLTWTAANAGSYFVRVAAEPGSATGCDAGYRVRVGQ